MQKPLQQCFWGPVPSTPKLKGQHAKRKWRWKSLLFLKNICFSDICLLLQPVWSACLVRAGCSENKTDRRVLVRKTNEKATITKGLRVDRCWQFGACLSVLVMQCSTRHRAQGEGAALLKLNFAHLCALEIGIKRKVSSLFSHFIEKIFSWYVLHHIKSHLTVHQTASQLANYSVRLSCSLSVHTKVTLKLRPATSASKKHLK